MSITFRYEKMVDSTQDFARKLLQEGCHTPFVLAADQQSRGRGREKRVWHSPAAGNLYATLGLVFPTIHGVHIASCNLVAALVIAEELRRQQIAVSIKWPNDLLIGEKKLGGILTESFSFKGQQAFLIGFGLNVNCMESDLEGLQNLATSLKIYDGLVRDKEELLRQITSNMVAELSLWHRDGFIPFKERYLSSFFLNPGESLFRDGQKLEFCGIADNGALEVKTLKGENKILYSGEIL